MWALIYIIIIITAFNLVCGFVKIACLTAGLKKCPNALPRDNIKIAFSSK